MEGLISFVKAAIGVAYDGCAFSRDLLLRLHFQYPFTTLFDHTVAIFPWVSSDL